MARGGPRETRGIALLFEGAAKLKAAKLVIDLARDYVAARREKSDGKRELAKLETAVDALDRL